MRPVGCFNAPSVVEHATVAHVGGGGTQKNQRFCKSGMCIDISDFYCIDDNLDLELR